MQGLEAPGQSRQLDAARLQLDARRLKIEAFQAQTGRMAVAGNAQPNGGN